MYVEDTGSVATSYTATDVTAGTRHVYRVNAINEAGVGKRSNFVRVDPQGESTIANCQWRRNVGPLGLLTSSKKVLANRPA